MSAGAPADLGGQVAIVTGGGWNIGRAVAERLAAAGARVVVAGRRAELLDATAAGIRERGGEVLAVPTDVTDPARVDALVARTEEVFGPVDLLAALAGGGSVDAPADQLAPEDWDRVLRTNVSSAFYCARAVLPAMARRDAGSILFCSGGGGSFPALGVNFLPYACAKAAVCRLTDQLTAELWETGIRVNCIDPGLVPDATRLAEIEAEEARRGEPFPDAEHRRRPEDVAELATWLLSDASRPTRGRVVSIYDTWWRDPESVAAVDASVAAYRLRRNDKF